MKQLLPLVFVLSVLSLAQVPDGTGSTEQEQGKPTFDALGRVAPGHFSYSGNISFEQQYDDNVFPNTAPGEGGALSAAGAQISLVNVGRRSLFQLHYEPSFRVSETGPDNSGGSHSFYMSLMRQRSTRTTFTGTGVVNVISSNNLPSRSFVLSGDNLLPVFSPSLVPVGTRDINPYGSLMMTHLLTRRTRIEGQLEGTANFVDREDNDTTPLSGRVLSDSYAVGGRIGMYRDISANTAIGGLVRYRYVATEQAFSPHLHNEVVGLSVRHKFARGWEAEVSAGPSFVVRAGDQILSYALNGSLGRTTVRSRYGISYADGIQSTAISSFTSQRAIGAYAARQLTRRWGVESTFAFSQNSSDFTFGHAYSLAASGSMSYRVSEHLEMRGGYSHSKQTSENTFIDVRDFDRNLYSFGFVYTFGTAAGGY